MNRLRSSRYISVEGTVYNISAVVRPKISPARECYRMQGSAWQFALLPIPFLSNKMSVPHKAHGLTTVDIDCTPLQLYISILEIERVRLERGRERRK
jgi:hypothetical protein